MGVPQVEKVSSTARENASAAGEDASAAGEDASAAGEDGSNAIGRRSDAHQTASASTQSAGIARPGLHARARSALAGFRASKDRNAGAEFAPAAEARPPLQHLEIGDLRHVFRLATIATTADQRPGKDLAMQALQLRFELRSLHASGLLCRMSDFGGPAV